MYLIVRRQDGGQELLLYLAGSLDVSLEFLSAEACCGD